MKKLLLTIFVLFLGLGVYAQHFSNLPEKERNERLIKEAKKVFKTRYPDVEYTEYGTPEVVCRESKSEYIDGKRVGKLRYTVHFRYDKANNPSNFEGEYAFWVSFSDELGIPLTIFISVNGGWWRYLANEYYKSR